MEKVNDLTEAVNKISITVEVLIDAPVEKVWDSWTAPEHIVNWCQASDDWHAPYADNDVREEGKFKTTMAAKDGSFSFDFEGVYTEVITNKSIKYILADKRTVSITFVSHGNTTFVTETFDPEKENSIELQKGGWQAILDNFKKYTEGLK